MKTLSFAIIGGGPAGFYTAKLLSKLPCHPQIHIYEKQLCPFGLIRYGVAPDHISIKKSQMTLSEITNYQNFYYFGNKNINKNILEELKDKYSGVIFAYGASGNMQQRVIMNDNNNYSNSQGQNNNKSIQQQSKNIIKNARQVVYWYNNHPSYQKYHLDLSKTKNITIIGNGNVAIDIARIFLRDPQQLAQTQISLNALQSLKNNSIQNVSILARRGVVQSAFALKQVRQLTKCNIKIYAIQQQLQQSLNDTSYYQCTALGNNFCNIIRMNKRKLDFMKEHCKIIKLNELNNFMQNGEKKIIFRYLLNPKQLKDNNKKLLCNKTFLYGEAFNQSCKQTDEIQQIQHDMLIFSTGFQVSDIQGKSISKNKLPNSNGCLFKNNQDKIDIGVYASGWCKTGPQGVLDQTLLGCEQTFNNIRIHYKNLVIKQKPLINIKDIFESQKNINFDQYKKVRELQLKNGNQAKFVKKKFLQHELKQIYGIKQ